jgi:uncharacterized membrane protein
VIREWLRRETPRWTAAGVIDADTERRILEHHGDAADATAVRPNGRTVPLALAAVALCLAVGLIACDQWRATPFAAKVGVAVVLMAATHATGYWFRFYRDDACRGNVLCLIGSLCYGSALLLVADQAGLAELYPWMFFLWAVGTLPLGLVLSSLPLLLLTSVLATVWFVWQMATPTGATSVSLFLGFVLCLLHWAYTNQSRVLLVATVAALVLWWSMFPIALDLGRQGFFWIATLGPVLYLVGRAHGDDGASARVFRAFAAPLTLVGLVATALPSVAADAIAADNTMRHRLVALPVLLLCAAVWWRPIRPRLACDWAMVGLLAVLSLLPAALGLVTHGSAVLDATTAGAILATLLGTFVVAYGAVAMVKGAATNRHGCTLLGSTSLVAWAMLLVIDLADRLLLAAFILGLVGTALMFVARFGRRLWDLYHERVSRQSAGGTQTG